MTADRRRALRRLVGRLGTCLLLLAALPAAAATVALDSRAERVDLAGGMALLHDPSGRLHLADVLEMEQDFRLALGGDLIRSFNAGVFWLRFSLVNVGPQAQTRWLSVGTPRLQSVKLFLQDGARWQVLQAGKGLPMREKPIVAAEPVFPIVLAPGQNREFLVRVDATSALDMTTTLWEPHAYRLAALERHLLRALIIGGILLGSLLAMVVYVRLREPPYFWLALMLLLITGVEAARENLLALYLWPESVGFPSQILTALAAMAMFAMTKLVSGALNLARHAPLGDRLLRALRWTAVGGMLLSGIDYGAGARVLALVAITLLPASLALSLRMWRRGVAPASGFALAFAVAMLTEMARQLANLGLLPWAPAMNFSLGGFLLSTPFILVGMIEQTRQMSQRLEVAEQMQQAKSTFLAQVSHELRSPLNTILGFARMLARGSPRLSLREGTLGIEKNALRLLGLIDELLDEARAAAGKLALSPAPLALGPWLDDLRDSARMAIETKGNRFVCRATGDLPAAVRLDGTRLHQVLENLLNNANRHTHGGEIRLECAATADATTATLRFVIEDDGEGMTAAAQKVVFEPFVRGGEPAGTHRQASGFGLGLPICRDLVRLMGGEITLTSAPGRGSRFEFTLDCPLVAATDLPAPPDHDGLPPSRPEPAPPPPADASRALIVDDDAQQLRLLGELLEESGFSVRKAGSGHEADAAIGAQHWDVIVTDQMMADGDGWHVLRQARADAAGVPVVLLSALPPLRPEDFPPELEFDAVLRKPLASEDVLACLVGLRPISAARWRQLAAMAGEGEISGIEDWIAALDAHPLAARWTRAALHRLDLDTIKRVAERAARQAPP